METLTKANMPVRPLPHFMTVRMQLSNAIMVLLLILLQACGNSGSRHNESNSWPAALKQGHGTLKALYVPAEGFAYHDASGQLTGVTVDILEDFAVFVLETYGVSVEISFVKENDWSVFYQSITEASDGVIGFGNVTITPERKHTLVFSPPYMTNIASLITHKHAPLLSSPKELGQSFAGRNALAFEGTLHESRLRALTDLYYPEASIVMAHSNDEIIEKLSQEDLYFAYIDLYNFYRAQKRGIPLKRHPAADITGEQFGYIMPLETSWGEVMDAYFQDGEGLLQSARYRDILHTHLGSELANMIIKANQAE